MLIKPPRAVVPGDLMFYCFFFWHFAVLYLRAASADRREKWTILGAIGLGAKFPSFLSRSPWNFSKWWEI